jgi:hypothetical protein
VRLWQPMQSSWQSIRVVCWCLPKVEWILLLPSRRLFFQLKVIA